MEHILLFIIIILPVFLVIIYFLRKRKYEGYIEESLIRRIVDKEKLIAELKELCLKKKWHLQLAGDHILIRTNTSIFSFGEIITITFEEKNENVFMKVSSKPKVKTTRIDYNKNKNNVELISGLSTATD